MSIARWLARNEFSAQQYNIARGLLMTGPRSQEPSFKAIKKILLYLRSGKKMDVNDRRLPWRALPRAV